MDDATITVIAHFYYTQITVKFNSEHALHTHCMHGVLGVLGAVLGGGQGGGLPTIPGSSRVYAKYI